MKPKFNIGDIVYSKVRRRGCAEPSYCYIGEMFTIKSVTQCGNHFVYTCGYDCYEFHEDELMSFEEFMASKREEYEKAKMKERYHE